MLSINQVFDEAIRDKYAIKFVGAGYHSVSLYSVKIVRDTHSYKVDIYSTEKSETWYTKVSPEALEIFLAKGWRYGVYVVSLSTINLKVAKLNTLLELLKMGKGGSKHSIIYVDNEIRILEQKQKEIQIKLNKIK
jgi:hypothetical protein